MAAIFNASYTTPGDTIGRHFPLFNGTLMGNPLQDLPKYSPDGALGHKICDRPNFACLNTPS
jgi:hypothetical protein